jgi:hypothetical protein
MEYPTWNIANWKDVDTTESLLAMRAKQLERQSEDISVARRNIEEARAEDKRRHDAKIDRPEPIRVGDWVLLHDTKLDTSHSAKLKGRWRGPYIVTDHYPDRNAYRLAELDGSSLKEAVQAGSRLKYFYRREDHPILKRIAVTPDEACTPSPSPPSIDEFGENAIEYEVRDIVGERTLHGQKQYLVEWVGYPEKTWEPIENLDGCQETIDAYKKRSKRKAEKEKRRAKKRARKTSF